MTNGAKMLWTSNGKRTRTRIVDVVTTMKLGGGVMVRVAHGARGEAGKVFVVPPSRLSEPGR